MRPKTHRWKKVAKPQATGQDDFDFDEQHGNKSNKKTRKPKKLQWRSTKHELQLMEIKDLRNYIAETEYE